MGRGVLTSSEVPLGYAVPSFPSLFWPLDDHRYKLAYLYYPTDIWRFTMLWTLIFFGAFYGAAGAWAAFVARRRPSKALLIVGLYLLIGGVQGFIAGSVVGLLMGAIYKAGLFKMSTWIPMCCGVLQVLFNVVTSYSMMSVLF